MNKYYGLALVFMSLSTTIYGSTEAVPLLDQTTVNLPQKHVLNKCVGPNNTTIYTQFACPENHEHITEDWQAQSNLTLSSPKKAPTITQRPPNQSPQDPASPVDLTQELFQGLKLDEQGLPDLKNMSPTEIIQQGIKMFMLRKNILDAI